MKYFLIPVFVFSVLLSFVLFSYNFDSDKVEINSSDSKVKPNQSYIHMNGHI